MKRQSVPPHLYSRDYFLQSCDGYKDFAATRGARVTWRFQEAIRAADLSPGLVALDIGCGRGEIPVQMARSGGIGIGMDHAPVAMELCREALQAGNEGMPGTPRFVQGDAKALPFRDAAFDRIFILDIVEHLYPWELAMLTGEMQRVLKENGKVIIHTSPNRWYFDYGYPMLWRMHRMVCTLPARVQALLFGEVPPLPPRDPRALEGRGPEIHVNEMTITELRRAMRRYGFEGRIWLSVPPPAYRGYSLVRRWTWIHRLLDLWPVASLFPFRYFFAMHIFAVLTKGRGSRR